MHFRLESASCLKLPSILRENLLTGEDRLIPKKKTSYSYIAFTSIMRYAHLNFLFPVPCSLFPVPCSLFPKTRDFAPHYYENCYICVYKVFSDVEKSPESDTVYNSGNLLEKINCLQNQVNNFDARLGQLSALESNYLEISGIVKSYDQQLQVIQESL
jgi:hypothetical protein